jgi:hypothetical protein
MSIYSDFGSTVALAILAFTGAAPLRTGPVYLPRAIAHNTPYTIPFRFTEIPPLKEGGMLADLESSVLEHHPLNGMLADFPFGFSPITIYPTSV